VKRKRSYGVAISFFPALITVSFFLCAALKPLYAAGYILRVTLPEDVVDSHQFRARSFLVQKGAIVAMSYDRKGRSILFRLDKVHKGRATIYMIPDIQSKPDGHQLLAGCQEINIQPGRNISVRLHPRVEKLSRVSVKITEKDGSTLRQVVVEVADVTHVPPIASRHVWEELSLCRGRTNDRGEVVFFMVPGRRYRLRTFWLPQLASHLEVSYFERECVPDDTDRQEIVWRIDTGRKVIFTFVDGDKGGTPLAVDEMGITVMCNNTITGYTVRKGRLVLYPDIDPFLKGARKIRLLHTPRRLGDVRFEGPQEFPITAASLQEHVVPIVRKQYASLRVVTPAAPDLGGYAYLLVPGGKEPACTVKLNSRDSARVKPGEYRMVVHAPGYMIEEETIRLRRDARVEKKVRLRKGRLFTFRVTDTEGKQIPGVKWWKKRHSGMEEAVVRRGIILPALVQGWVVYKRHLFVDTISLDFDGQGRCVVHLDPRMEPVYKIWDVRSLLEGYGEGHYVTAWGAVSNEEETGEIHIRLSRRGCMVSGIVDAAEGVTVEGVSVYTLDMSSPLYVLTRPLDGGGKFTMNLGPGRYIAAVNVGMPHGILDFLPGTYIIKKFTVPRAASCSLGRLHVVPRMLVTRNMLSHVYKFLLK